MDTETSQPQGARAADEHAMRALHASMLDTWNTRDADAMAANFADDGEVIGFDGSQMNGRAQIAATLSGIFADHITGRYVGTVRSIRFLAPDVAQLQAIVGMVPPGQSDIASHLNAVQTLTATRHNGSWRAVLFQNTPAQLHGRPDLVERMTAELRQLL